MRYEGVILRTSKIREDLTRRGEMEASRFRKVGERSVLSLRYYGRVNFC